MVEFAYPLLAYSTIPSLIGFYALKNFTKKTIVYRYPLTSCLLKDSPRKKTIIPLLLDLLRLSIYGLLLLALARPRIPDSRTEMTVKGIDIMLTLDVSGSMILFDDLHDRRSRIDIARSEAINFINKRKYDPIGLVIFGEEVLTRAPLTLDKKILTDILLDTKVGTIGDKGTLLSWGLAAALNKLRSSQAQAKIIILLTDGSSSDGDADPKSICELAQKMGVKIYTIAIGTQEGGMFEDPFFGIQRYPASVNIELLKKLAAQTGGRFYESRKPKDLATIYSSIDALEKTELTSPLFATYHEYFYPLLVLAALLFFVELLIRLRWTILL
jgi:Ca-activated chloride channel family protein